MSRYQVTYHISFSSAKNCTHVLMQHNLFFSKNRNFTESIIIANFSLNQHKHASNADTLK